MTANVRANSGIQVESREWDRLEAENRTQSAFRMSNTSGIVCSAPRDKRIAAAKNRAKKIHRKRRPTPMFATPAALAQAMNNIAVPANASACKTGQRRRMAMASEQMSRISRYGKRSHG